MKDDTRLAFARRAELVIQLIRDGLDDRWPGDAAAGVAGYSRWHFQRTFKALMGETPGSFRRRLLLERAAWQLRETSHRVTDVALDAGYDSLEAFTRAFRRAFGESPSAFRLLERNRFELATPNEVHFRPGLPYGGATKSDGWSMDMDLVDRLIGHDLWMTRRLLESAAPLSDAQLDRPLEGGEWTLRSLLDKCVWNKENWVAAMTGQPEGEEKDRSIAGMIRRLDLVAPDYAGLARGVRDVGDWDKTFTDGLCTPPETFSFGGAFAHIITHSAHRRALIADALQKLGVPDVEDVDPIDWERKQQPVRR